MITVLLVDDHVVVREGLRALIETQPDLTVAAEAGHSAEALVMIDAQPVDLVVTDLQMPGGGGLELIKAIRQRHPELPIMVLTAFGGSAEVTAALAAGATSYLLKDTPRAGLFEALRNTSAGTSVLSPATATTLVHGLRTAPEAPRLSGRELQILAAVAEGRTNGEIARRLRISETTVKTYLVRLYAKLEVPDRASAVAAGYRLGLLPLEP
ncbi:response regulator [Microlunatus parietis]|uniref:DNA-binding NarL/FixJ family response regulator n=1 Tax=Microlunatus parietis TaxID=682979 RepID=A0A7Y9I4Z9_9ACTN|nr:response regulator transcription factor [Microlunatus parietis]NYE70406.1 DNA-binding NarL/FixJ family response regulator [Microlunatus parietis]